MIIKSLDQISLDFFDVVLTSIQTPLYFKGGSSQPVVLPSPPKTTPTPAPAVTPPPPAPAPAPTEEETETETQKKKEEIEKKSKGRRATILTGLLTEKPEVKKPSLKKKLGE